MTTKQCGTCEFWDRQPKSDYATNTGECKHPMPSCVNSWDRRMLHYEGRTCPTYKEQNTDQYLIKAIKS